MADKTGLRRALGFWDLVLFGLICIAPVAPFALFGFVNAFSAGAVVPPYVLGAIGLAFTGLSYATMAEIAPQAGSAYGFARLALGDFAGFAAGWAILLDYVVVGALVLLYGALYFSPLANGVPVETLMIASAVLMLALNLLGIRFSARVNLVLTGLQIAVGLVFAAGALWLLLAPGGSGLTQAPLWTPSATPASIVAATPLAVIAFLGFDAISTLSEEVKSSTPGVLVGRATIVTLALMLGLFVSISWLLADLARGLDLSDPATAGMVIVAERLSWLATPLSLVVALAYILGLSPAILAGASRLAFAMARARELPRPLAYVHPGRQVPMVAVLVLGAMLFIIAWIALPNVDVLGGLVSFGAITGFILVNLSVIVHFGVRGHSRRWLRHWIAPALGVLVLLWVLSGVVPQALELGAAWLALGVIWYFGRRALAGRTTLPRS
jgi:amino acid transporter